MAERIIYVQMMKDCLHGLSDLIADAPGACRALLWIVRQAGSTGRLQARQSTIAAYLGITERQLRRDINTLRRRGWIATTGRSGQLLEYVVTPFAFWYMKRELLGWAQKEYPGQVLGIEEWRTDPGWGLNSEGAVDNDFWIQVSKRALSSLGALVVEQPAAARVLLLMLADMGTGNRAIAHGQGVIGDRLGMSRWTVARAVSVLKERGWISSVNPSYYIINPHVFWGERRGADAMTDAETTWDKCHGGGPVMRDEWHVPARFRGVVAQVVGVPGGDEDEWATIE